ncbi:hypothetical protein BC827DRAFT_1158778 [Russula dissimulans]|nr:hypothetical protein BC827DRAFT_1158778 [Russula dissimulans]
MSYGSVVFGAQLVGDRPSQLSVVRAGSNMNKLSRSVNDIHQSTIEGALFPQVQVEGRDWHIRVFELSQTVSGVVEFADGSNNRRICAQPIDESTTLVPYRKHVRSRIFAGTVCIFEVQYLRCANEDRDREKAYTARVSAYSNSDPRTTGQSRQLLNTKLSRARPKLSRLSLRKAKALFLDTHGTAAENTTPRSYGPGECTICRGRHVYPGPGSGNFGPIPDTGKVNVQPLDVL